jgi:hypothetical protein
MKSEGQRTRKKSEEKEKDLTENTEGAEVTDKAGKY